MVPPLPQPRTTLPVLRGLDVLLVLLVTLAAMVLSGALGVMLGIHVVGRDSAVVLAVLLASAGGWAALWWALVHRHGWGWREMGFVPATDGRQLLWEVPAAMAASLLGAALLAASLGLPAREGPSPERGLADAALLSPFTLPVVLACVVLVLPAAEEVLFRRVLLDWSLTRTRPVLAVPATAAAFAAVHVVPAAMAYLVFIGLFTGLLRLRHGSLWAPLALHALNNALVVLVAISAR